MAFQFLEGQEGQRRVSQPATTNPKAGASVADSFTALEAGSPGSRCWAWSPVRTFSSWLADGCLLAVFSHGQISLGP